MSRHPRHPETPASRLLAAALGLALALLSRAAPAAVTWEAPVEVVASEGGYRAHLLARLDAPFEAASEVVLAVQDYASWVPTVSGVEDLVREGDRVRASFVHRIPILPDFPCVVEILVSRGPGLLGIDIGFVRCIFDHQRMRIRLARRGRVAVLELDWAARLDRWYVPGVALEAFLRSVARSTAGNLDRRARSIASGEP